MKASFDGTVVRLGKEGRVLYDQSGYGRLEQEGVKLSDQEALYLLHPVSYTHLTLPTNREV